MEKEKTYWERYGYIEGIGFTRNLLRGSGDHIVAEISYRQCDDAEIMRWFVAVNNGLGQWVDSYEAGEEELVKRRIELPKIILSAGQPEPVVELPPAVRSAVEAAHNIDLAEMLLKYAPEKAEYANDCVQRARNAIYQIIADNPELKITVTEFMYQFDNMGGFGTAVDKVTTILSAAAIGLKTAVKHKPEASTETGDTCYGRVRND
jgi:hypothetical protein